VDPLLRAELMACLNRDAAAIAARFGLRYRAIEPERPRVTAPSASGSRTS
jgi:hypothetical protein